MNKTVKKTIFCTSIALGSVAVTLLMGNIQFFKLLDLKAQDAHFVLRGPLPVKDIQIIGIDDKAMNSFPDLMSFWQPYYADAMRAAADGGAKVLVLDVAFSIPVKKYMPENDGILAGAFAEVSPVMPIICAFVPAAMEAQQNPEFTVPLNMMASAFGTSAFANLTADSDDFVRRQVLIEEPKAGTPTEALMRGMALRASEKFLGKDVELKNGKLFLDGRDVQMDEDRNLTINYAGPADTFPRISLFDVVDAYRKGNKEQLKKWLGGKAVLLGPDNIDDRHATPFYTAFTLSKKWRTPGVEVHANAVRTLLTGEFLKPVPQWLLIAALLIASSVSVVVVTSLALSQTAIWGPMTVIALLGSTHVMFRQGQLLSTSQMLLSFGWALVGGIVYRFATAEKKSTFFKNAIGLFVGKQVASSLEHSEKISLTGKRQMVTILFTDIRGFTAFCESKDPAVVVDLLNIYMSTMVGIIVKYGGHVNKFIGDGILAVFCDDDPGAKPGDHAIRCCRCAQEMVVNEVCDFKTGAGFHVGEVIIGNVGSQDKLEFTVLGNTVNMASRLESLNKEAHARMLLSEEANEMLYGQIDTIYVGAVPVKGKTDLMKIFSSPGLFDEQRNAELNAQYPEQQAKNKAMIAAARAKYVAP